MIMKMQNIQQFKLLTCDKTNTFTLINCKWHFLLLYDILLTKFVINQQIIRFIGKIICSCCPYVDNSRQTPPKATLKHDCKRPLKNHPFLTKMKKCQSTLG